jgi:hypothetical protein
MVRIALTVLVLAIALVGASCGGDDESASDTDTAVVETTDDTTTDDTTTDDTTTDDGDTTSDDDVDLGDFLAGDCQELIAAYAAMSSAFAAAATGGGDLDESTEAFSQFVDEAPEEIQGDIQILAEAYAEYAEAIRDLDFQAGETPDAETFQALQAASESFNTEEVQAASERLSTWTTENCG